MRTSSLDKLNALNRSNNDEITSTVENLNRQDSQQKKFYPLKTLNVGYIVLIKTLNFLLLVSLLMAIFGCFMLFAFKKLD
jgi:hypothetical protein